MVLNGGKSRWFAVEGGLDKDAPCHHSYNIYLMEMAEELERAHLRNKLEEC